MRAWTAGMLWVVVAGAGCGAGPARGPRATRDATLAVRIDDHLSLGLRLDAFEIALDGRALASSEPPPEAVEPGLHAVRVTAKVSLACGLFGEPRTTVTVHAWSTVRTQGAPARMTVVLFARAPTARPDELVGVEFRGEGAEIGVRGAPLLARHAECGALDPVAGTTCEVEALVGEARAAKDAILLSCTGDRLSQIHALRAVLDDARDVAGATRTTNDEAMHAQLRARYAETRIGALADEARQCIGKDSVNPQGVVYSVDDACSASSPTALDER